MKLYKNSKVRFLRDCDGSRCYGGKPLPSVGWNTFGNLYPRILNDSQVELLKEQGYLKVDRDGSMITCYVLDKALTSERKSLINKQLVQASDIFNGKYLN